MDKDEVWPRGKCDGGWFNDEWRIWFELFVKEGKRSEACLCLSATHMLVILCFGGLATIFNLHPAVLLSPLYNWAPPHFTLRETSNPSVALEGSLTHIKALARTPSQCSSPSECPDCSPSSSCRLHHPTLPSHSNCTHTSRLSPPAAPFVMRRKIHSRANDFWSYNYKKKKKMVKTTILKSLSVVAQQTRTLQSSFTFWAGWLCEFYANSFVLSL